MSRSVSGTNETEGPYAAAWRAYRRAGWIIFLLLAGIPIGVFPIAGLLRHWFTIPLSLADLSRFWLLVMVIAVFWENQWRCPRCGKKFNVPVGRRRGLLESKCPHCWLPKWAEWDPRKRWRDL